MIFSRYAKWLHTRWPAGVVEKLPEVREDGSTNVPGIYVVGDLTGIPLLKFSSHSGARAIKSILADPKFKRGEGDSLDVAIIGAGVSGVAAAMEAKKDGLKFEIFEASQVFSTVVNFPKGKPIYTYPTEMTPDGDLQFTAQVKEALVDEMEAHRKRAGIEPTPLRIEKLERKGNEILLHSGKGEPKRSKRVVVAIGRSGNFRKIGCPGEDLDKVYNRLHDPKEFAGKNVLVVGGGDSALETVIAIASAGGFVTLSYRKKEFSRPKPGNLEMLKKLERDPKAEVMVEKPTSERVTTAGGSSLRGNKPPGWVHLALETTVKKIEPDKVTLQKGDGTTDAIKNDVVFSMIGREAPLDFFRRSGINVRGEWRASTFVSFALFFGFCWFMYLWKGGTSVNAAFKANGWFPFNIAGESWLAITLREPGFYYSLAYTLCVLIFGLKRIQRRKTPYVTRQTLTLMAVQSLPLFFIPYFLLPWMGKAGAFDAGILKSFADEFFPFVDYGQGREYWRAFGFILAWPLFIWNFFTEKPMWGWLIVGGLQTFVMIPWMIRRWGKGAYCGWLCSCGALAETLGDTHRTKMPHGPKWNRLNMVGQVALAAAGILLLARVVTWVKPIGWLNGLYYGLLNGWGLFGLKLNYYYVVDIFLAGIVGVGLYFHFSGRVWCRFACPLAALMHIYARFSKFRIFAKKEKCISCNVCTSVCHQGIDIMNFANKGLAMEDPECVRCSACVQSCPTGVLTFGRHSEKGVVYDALPASPVQMREAAQ